MSGGDCIADELPDSSPIVVCDIEQEKDAFASVVGDFEPDVPNRSSVRVLPSGYFVVDLASILPQTFFGWEAVMGM